MSDYGLKTNNDFNGQISDLVKVINECSRLGINVKDIINVLRNPNKKEELKGLKEFTVETEIQKQQEQENRARDFGIGE